MIIAAVAAGAVAAEVAGNYDGSRVRYVALDVGHVTRQYCRLYWIPIDQQKALIKGEPGNEIGAGFRLHVIDVAI